MSSLVPYSLIADEAWRLLESASDDPVHPMRLCVLATVEPGEGPDARLMLLRGAHRNGGRLWFHTDRRSDKVQQLRVRPAVCAVAYEPQLGVQLRVRGAALLHEADEAASLHWEQIGAATRALYAAPESPGDPLRQPDPRLMCLKRALDAGAEAAARGNFAVLEVIVRVIEWLQVHDDAQRRAVMHAATAWAVQPIAP
jgi:general stress protein 26